MKTDQQILIELFKLEKTSVPYIQRKYQVSYEKACWLFEELKKVKRCLCAA